MKHAPRFLRPSGVLLAAALFAPVVHADIRTKNNTTNNLNLAASWNSVPGANDIARWEATVGEAQSLNLGADLTWLGISIVNPGGAVTINSGNTLTLGMAGIDMSAATQDLTISSNLTLQSYRRQIWNVAADRVLTLNGDTFTRSEGATLHLQGAGTVAASNISTTNGIIGPWASFGTGTATRYATISGGNIVGLTGTAAATAADVTDTTGAVNYDLAAVGALGTGASFNTLRYSGTTGAVTGDFTANGLMTVAASTLTLSGNATIGSSRELVVNGANANNNIILAGAISDSADGASGVTKTGAGMVTFSGSNDYTGVTVVSSGLLKITNANALGSTEGRTVVVGGDAASTSPTGNPSLPGGQLLIDGNNLTIAEPLTFIGRGNNTNPAVLQNTGGSNTLSGPIIADTATGAVRFATSSRLTITGGVTNTGSGLFVLNPSATGVFAFTTTPLNLGGGTFYLDTAGTIELAVGGNTWSGARVAAGTLKLMAANVLPATASLTVGLGYSTSGTVDLNGFDQSISWLEGTYTTGVRTITSATDATLTLNQTANKTYNGQFTGALSVVKGGGSILTLEGASSHTGDTRVNAGTLNIANVDVLKNSTLDTGTSGSQTIGFTAAGTNTYNLGGLKGADALNIGGNTLNVGANNQDTSYTGDITGSGGGVTKVGTGTLLVGGSLSGLSLVNVTEGTMGGTGSIAAPVVVSAGASLQAGDGVVAGDDLAVDGNLTLSDNSAIKLTLGAGLTHSALVRLGGTWTFDLNQAFTFSEAGVTTGVYENIITNLAGNEAGLASINTWVITNEGYTGAFSFDGTNVDLTLTTVPEPSALVSLLGGVGLLAGFKRRRGNR